MFPSPGFFERKRVLLLAHNRADADSMGSCIAFFHALKAKSKPQIGVIDHATPMAHQLAVACTTTYTINPIPLDNFDAIVLMDFNSAEMAGSMAAALLHERPRLFAMDHHPGIHRPLAPAAHQLVDAQSPANSQLVYFYLKKHRIRLTPEMAIALTAAMISDTHRFERANPATFNALAELIPKTKKPYENLAAIFSGNRPDSERNAVLQAFSRSATETIQGWLISTSHVSAFGQEAANQFVHSGADLALVESVFGPQIHLHVRASNRLVRAGFSIPVHVFAAMENAGWGDGGGHDAAGSFGSSETNLRSGELVRRALTILSKQLPPRMSTQTKINLL